MGFGIPSWQVDGMDPLAVKLAMEQAVAAPYCASRLADAGARIDALMPRVNTAEAEALTRMKAGLASYAAVVEAIVVKIQRGEINDPWRANAALEPAKGATRSA